MDVIVGIVCKELYQPPSPLREVANLGTEAFTTGDDFVDKVLGGGLRTGMLWEICGEKYATKHYRIYYLQLTTFLQQRRQDPAGDATCLDSAAAFGTRRTFWIGVLYLHSRRASNHATTTDP